MSLVILGFLRICDIILLCEKWKVIALWKRVHESVLSKRGKSINLYLMDNTAETVVFTTTNNSFGPTEISYLENRFCNLATEARLICSDGIDYVI